MIQRYNYNYLSDNDFLINFTKEKLKEQYVKINVLDWKENFIESIEGRVVSGNLNIDGNSAIRRSASLNFVCPQDSSNFKNPNHLLSINKKVSMEIGFINTTDKYTEYEMLWFPLGIYVITDLSLTYNSEGTNISLSLKDKMALLNGECGGVIPATTQFDEYATENLDGSLGITKPTIYQIIHEAVHHFGGEDLDKIVIDNLDTRVKQVQSWNGDTPLYYYEDLSGSDSTHYFTTNYKEVYDRFFPSDPKDAGAENEIDYYMPDDELPFGTPTYQLDDNGDLVLENGLYSDEVANAEYDKYSHKLELINDPESGFTEPGYNDNNKPFYQKKYEYLSYIFGDNDSLDDIHGRLKADLADLYLNVDGLLEDVDDVDEWYPAAFNDIDIDMVDDSFKPFLNNLVYKYKEYEKKVDYVYNLPNKTTSDVLIPYELSTADNTDTVVGNIHKSIDKYTADFYNMAQKMANTETLKSPDGKLYTFTFDPNTKQMNNGDAILAKIKQQLDKAKEKLDEYKNRQTVAPKLAKAYERVCGQLQQQRRLGHVAKRGVTNGNHIIADMAVPSMGSHTEYWYYWGWYRNNKQAPSTGHASRAEWRVTNSTYVKLIQKNLANNKVGKSHITYTAGYPYTYYHYWHHFYLAADFSDKIKEAQKNYDAWDAYYKMKKERKEGYSFAPLGDTDSIPIFTPEDEDKIKFVDTTTQNLFLETNTMGEFTPQQDYWKSALNYATNACMLLLIKAKTDCDIRLMENQGNNAAENSKNIKREYYTYYKTIMNSYDSYINNIISKCNIIVNSYNTAAKSYKNRIEQNGNSFQDLERRFISGVIAVMESLDSTKEQNTFNTFIELYKSLSNEYNSIKSQKEEWEHIVDFIENPGERVYSFEKEYQDLYDKCGFNNSEVAILWDIVDGKNSIEDKKEELKILVNLIEDEDEKEAQLKEIEGIVKPTAASIKAYNIFENYFDNGKELGYNIKSLKKMKDQAVSQKKIFEEKLDKLDTEFEYNPNFSFTLDSINLHNIDGDFTRLNTMTAEYGKYYQYTNSINDAVNMYNNICQLIPIIIKKYEKLKQDFNKFKTQYDDAIDKANSNFKESLEAFKSTITRQYIANPLVETNKEEMLKKLQGMDGLGYKVYERGENIGYIYTDFYYPSELILNAGQTVVDLLEAIKGTLGNFEYFYDVYGYFHFREKKNYLNISQSTLAYQQVLNNEDINNDYYLVDFTNGKSVYDLSDTELIISMSNNPLYQNIKNDFVVWGKRKTDNDKNYPIRFHLAIDEKPVMNDESYDVYFYTDSDNLTRAVIPKKVDSKDEMERNSDLVYMINGDESTLYKWNYLQDKQDGEFNTYSIHGFDHHEKLVPKNWRDKLYLQGIVANNAAVDSNYYYTELINEWIKLYNTETQQFYLESLTQPENLDFYLDLIDTNSAVGEFSVSNIGRRTIVVTDENVNCMFAPEYPDLVIIEQTEDIEKQKELINECILRGQNYYQMSSDLFNSLNQGYGYYSAYEKVKELLYQYTGYNETISLEMIPMYFLEPNIRISLYNEEAGVSGDYMINSISLPLDNNSNMSLSCTKVLQQL